MSCPKNTFFETDYDSLPDEMPIFPLHGVLLLPRGNLPLNIFEERYLKMVDDALRDSRMIGMIQPHKCNKTRTEENKHHIYNIGCAGRITSFSETDDGRIVITLTGVSRFAVKEEIQPHNGYRRVKPDWEPYKRDLEPSPCLDLDREKLFNLLEKYFIAEGLTCNEESMHSASDNKLMTCLAMICPLDANEKQALLEAKCCQARTDMFMTMMEMFVHNLNQTCDNANAH